MNVGDKVVINARSTRYASRVPWYIRKLSRTGRVATITRTPDEKFKRGYVIAVADLEPAKESDS